MRNKYRNDVDKNSFSCFKELNIGNIDKEKLSIFIKDYPLGIKNYFLFQNYFCFKWPYWLFNSFSIKSKTFNPITPYLLLNNSNRDWMSFSNRRSSNRIFIDPAGMISLISDIWSIEFWILEKNICYRPQERISSVKQKLDLNTSLISTIWKEANFEFHESIYGIKDEADELVLHLNAIVHKSNTHHCMFVVMRPYNILSIGGINKIEYNSKSKLTGINNVDRIYFETKPDYFLGGNASFGDIDFNDLNKKTGSIKCDYGMATLGLGYNLTRGTNEFTIRINTGGKKAFNNRKLNYSKIKSEYIDHTSILINTGFKARFPEKSVENWLNGSKISALKFLDDNIINAISTYNADLRFLFYITSGYNRMGFFNESIRILNEAASKIGKSKPDIRSILEKCYFICAVTDYFKLSRDLDYVKGKYKFIREISGQIIQHSGNIKDNNPAQYENSIENYAVMENHIHDTILISFTLFQISYLARCLGIFNDELKFEKESHRLEKIILNELVQKPHANDSSNDEQESHDENIRNKTKGNIFNYRNENFVYNVFAGYPFQIKSLTDENLKKITDKISGFFPENPLYFKSIGGSDMLFSIIFAINLLRVKDPRVHNIIAKIIEFGGEKYVLQDYINPKTGCGIRGDGDSLKVISAFFILLRSVIFMDSHELLEIFPLPKSEWFSEGSEIEIQNAPSLFGNINFKVITIKNEVQFYFNDLPKFLPPQMRINLPFPTKVKQEDDFILKKEIGNSFLIHGWPSIIRFIKE
ncbi:MAG: hypothetical protein V1874_00135 [Spirochaetota bacterium]